MSTEGLNPRDPPDTKSTRKVVASSDLLKPFKGVSGPNGRTVLLPKGKQSRRTTEPLYNLLES